MIGVKSNTKQNNQLNSMIGNKFIMKCRKVIKVHLSRLSNFFIMIYVCNTSYKVDKTTKKCIVEYLSRKNIMFEKLRMHIN